MKKFDKTTLDAAAKTVTEAMEVRIQYHLGMVAKYQRQAARWANLNDPEKQKLYLGYAREHKVFVDQFTEGQKLTTMIAMINGIGRLAS